MPALRVYELPNLIVAGDKSEVVDHLIRTCQWSEGIRACDTTTILAELGQEKSSIQRSYKVGLRSTGLSLQFLIIRR